MLDFCGAGAQCGKEAGDYTRCAASAGTSRCAWQVALNQVAGGYKLPAKKTS